MQRKGLCILNGEGRAHTDLSGPYCLLVPHQDHQPLDPGHQVSGQEASVTTLTLLLCQQGLKQGPRGLLTGK